MTMRYVLETDNDFRMSKDVDDVYEWAASSWKGVSPLKVKVLGIKHTYTTLIELETVAERDALWEALTTRFTWAIRLTLENEEEKEKEPSPKVRNAQTSLAVAEAFGNKREMQNARIDLAMANAWSSK